MAGVGTTLLAAGTTLLIALAPATVAYWFIISRKRNARLARQSPLGGDLLRPPGHSLRAKLEELQFDLASDLAILLFIPAFPMTYLYLTARMGGQFNTLLVEAGLAVGAIAFVAFHVRSMLVKAERVDRLKLGLDAELAVGQELIGLVRQGAAVFHDVDAGDFNIDHVVVAQQGIFAVETKGYTKPAAMRGPAKARVTYDGAQLVMPTWSSTEPIAQAERQAQWLGKWLSSATGDRISVTPVVALPGWFVDRKGRGVVHVLNHRELERLLNIRTARPLTPAELQRSTHQLDQRCRNMRPLYRPDGPSGVSAADIGR